MDILMIVIGVITGCLGTLVGAGGGFILMPVLLLLYPAMSVKDVTMVSMTVIFFNSLSGTIAYFFMRRIDVKTGLIFASATLPGAVLGTIATDYIPRGKFNVIFGLFLLAVSLLLGFLKKPEKQELQNNGKRIMKCEVQDRYGKVFRYSYNYVKGIVISFFTGFVSPILGIGGGIIHVPAMIRLLCIPTHVATATSHFTLMIMSAASIATHLSFSHGLSFLSKAFLLSAGAVAGAQIGAALSKKFNDRYIVMILSFALFLAGLRIIFLNN
ncbi:MAG: sulfite exporter TauE/SafE family protein [bacterium]|nr:sulfite exporter TauE/SafE family protein [bacterium]